MAYRKKYSWFLVIASGLLLNLFGCATIEEGAKCVAGFSTRNLEEGRKNAIKKTFNYDYNTCYSKVKEALEEKGSYIYAEDLKKHMLAVYVSAADTTNVGLFFQAIDANHTQIELTSSSTSAKEFIAKRVFSHLEGTDVAEEEKGQADAKEEVGSK